MREKNRNRGNDLRLAIKGPIAITVLFTALLGSAALGQNRSAGTSNSNSEAPSISPTPAPTPVPVSAIISEADTLASRLAEISDDLAVKSDIAEIEKQMPIVRSRINEREPATEALLAADPTLDRLRETERDWQAEGTRIPGWKEMLQDRLSSLDAHLAELARLTDQWEMTLRSLRNPGPSESETSEAKIPGEIIARVDRAIENIAATRKEVETRRTALLSLQTKVSEIETRTRTVLDRIRESRNEALVNLFSQDAAPIWRVHEEVVSFREQAQATGQVVSDQGILLRQYFFANTDRFALHGLILLLLTSVLYWARARIRPYVEKEPKLQPASQIFELPVMTGLIVSVIFSGYVYAAPPRILSAILGAIAIVPVVVLLRRLVDRPLFLILNLLVVLFFVDRIRELLAGQPLTARLIFLAEMTGLIFFLVWFLKARRLERKVEARHHSLFRTIRRVIPIALAVVIAAVIANAIGFVSLSYVLGNGVLGSAYLALIIYTLVQILRSLVIFALRVPPLVKLQAVRNHRPIVRDKLLKIIYWLGAIIWALGVLNLFSIRDAVHGYVSSLLTFSVGYGNISISLGDLLLFAVTVWITLLVSRFLRFFLEEDVYSRVDLGGGVSYAISTVLHYAILVAGFMLAIAALGVDFTNFAIIAGAVGIGIGFGLQNIINNFVSGLILLFERPVKINDTVQIGEHTGSLKEIGLRASVLRKIDGSDVILPNSQLISEEVVNWTMTDDRRRVDVPVGVAYGTDPNQVISILIGLTEKYSSILIEPAPKALFLGMSDSSLDFELRVWTDDASGWVGMRSDLVTDVYNALNAAGIEIPFPQRDLNIRSIDPGAKIVTGPDEK